MNYQLASIVRSFLAPKPRMICICGQFKPGKKDPEFAWCKCANCGGWASAAMIADRGEHK